MTESNGQIIIYEADDGLTHIEVNIKDGTVWLSQQQIAELYQTSRTNVVGHIKNIYKEGELDEQRTCQHFRQVRLEGRRTVERSIPFYNLDMIVSLGYRVKSPVATKFRIWATKLLQEYIVKGFAIDDARLKGNCGGNFGGKVRFGPATEARNKNTSGGGRGFG